MKKSELENVQDLIEYCDWLNGKIIAFKESGSNIIAEYIQSMCEKDDCDYKARVYDEYTKGRVRGYTYTDDLNTIELIVDVRSHFYLYTKTDDYRMPRKCRTIKIKCFMSAESGKPVFGSDFSVLDDGYNVIEE